MSLYTDIVASSAELNEAYKKLKESPVVGPRTRVEPANGFLSTADVGVQFSG